MKIKQLITLEYREHPTDADGHKCRDCELVSMRYQSEVNEKLAEILTSRPEITRKEANKIMKVCLDYQASYNTGGWLSKILTKLTPVANKRGN